MEISMTQQPSSRVARMRARLLDLKHREDGAVTIDWVVLTAGLVILGVLVVGGISGPVIETIGRTISSGNQFLD